LTEYTTFEGKQCIKMAVNGLSRAGGTIGQIYIGNLAEYASGNINAGNLALYGIPFKPNRTYNLSITYYLESIGADTGSVNFFGAWTTYNSNGVRNVTIASNAVNVNSAGAVTGQWITATGTLTENETTMEYVGLRIGFGAVADLTTNGNGVVYISNISLTEVLPARTPVLSRNLATNRVAVRDMGTALRFDGVDDEVAIDGVVTALGNIMENPFTVSAWFRTTSTAQQTIMSMGRTTNVNPYLILDIGQGTAGKLRITTRDDTGAGDSAETTAISGNNGYFGHLVGVKNATGLYLYYKGQLVASDLSVTTGTATLNCANIGVLERTTKSGFFNGIIDEPRIWNRALTAQEVSDLYFNNIIPRNGLVAEYLFNEATGNTALDSSGNGNHGTHNCTYTTDVPLRARTVI
jgi:hypothetical protein